MQGNRNGGPPAGGSPEPGNTHTNPSCSTHGTDSAARPRRPGSSAQSPGSPGRRRAGRTASRDSGTPAARPAAARATGARSGAGSGRPSPPPGRFGVPEQAQRCRRARCGPAGRRRPSSPTQAGDVPLVRQFDGRRPAGGAGRHGRTLPAGRGGHGPVRAGRSPSPLAPPGLKPSREEHETELSPRTRQIDGRIGVSYPPAEAGIPDGSSVGFASPWAAVRGGHGDHSRACSIPNPSAASRPTAPPAAGGGWRRPASSARRPRSRRSTPPASGAGAAPASPPAEVGHRGRQRFGAPPAVGRGQRLRGRAGILQGPDAAAPQPLPHHRRGHHRRRGGRRRAHRLRPQGVVPERARAAPHRPGRGRARRLDRP